jgi:fatty-acyl-CoA synthase
MSETSTSTTPPVLTGRGMTLSDILARNARTTPDGVALRDPAAPRWSDRERTWAALDDRVTRLANALAARGVGPCERVAVLGLNSIPLVEALLAPLRLGALCVPVNFRLVAEEVAYLLADSGAAAVVVDAALAPVVDAARGPSVRSVLTIGGDYDDALCAASSGYRELPLADDTPAFVMYTSGTTGRPKGAVLSHRNQVLHSFSVLVHLGTPSDDRVWLSGAPLFHIGGLSWIVGGLLTGARVVLAPSGGFDPGETVALLERERVSSCFFVPAQWQAICALPGLAGHNLSALRRISWGAAPASTTLLRRMMAAFPQAIAVTFFGQTESSPVTCVLRGEDAVRKIGSVGTPLLGVEVRIVDDAMRDVPRGQVGEIVYRGPTIMREYWGKPAETAEAFRGGWFHSGDLVRQDEDGYVYVVDRKKDMIISGGENIYCAEVENVLAGDPQIADVAVIGVPDPRWGEAPLAVVTARDPANPPTTASVGAFCRPHLAGYKRPREVVVVAELPRNASGKVLKTQLRDRFGATQPIGEPSVEVPAQAHTPSPPRPSNP